MNDFTGIYLLALHQGIMKKASISGFKPFSGSGPTIAGAAVGGVVGGLGNAMLGSSEVDEKTGEKRNGVLARLLEGGAIGAGVGAIGGNIVSPIADSMAAKAILGGDGPVERGVAKNITLKDLATVASGGELSGTRTVGLLGSGVGDAFSGAWDELNGR